MIITIDGPAGAGKSTAARRLAERLGFRFLDTGAAYRAMALAVLESRVDPNDFAALTDLAQKAVVRLSGDRVFLNDRDVSEAIRGSEVTALVSVVADVPSIRERMGKLQRQAAADQDVITEGRDQGTIVFPDADLKFYLTADLQTRAERRCEELRRRGEDVSLDQVKQDILQRDARDHGRTIAPLRKAEDAIEVDNSSLKTDETIDLLERIVRDRLSADQSRSK